jgi:predicted phage baseplate assembly protein
MLRERPLTQAATVTKTDQTSPGGKVMRLRFDPRAAAAAAFVFKKEDVWPSISLESELTTGTTTITGEWISRRDLLNSEDEAPHFVVECEHDGSAILRFGDDRNGKLPDSGTEFTATYRIGNGLGGSVGGDTIAHVVTDDPRIGGIRNPLPSKSARDPESAAQIRRRAPQAFRTQMRAVTPEDYAEVTQRFTGVQRAAATMRWTGSWHTVFITVDRLGGLPLDTRFKAALVRHVEPFRMAGHDLEFNDPIDVSLEIGMTVCVARDYFRSAVREALLRVLSNRDLGNGLQGLFHPDRLSFGQTVYLSPIYAAARSVPGVESVEITLFQRQGQDETRFLKEGEMRLSRLEIPRLDNDPSFPEHGVLRLSLHGGK